MPWVCSWGWLYELIDIVGVGCVCEKVALALGLVFLLVWAAVVLVEICVHWDVDIEVAAVETAVVGETVVVGGRTAAVETGVAAVEVAVAVVV